jgi:hypothetical protein
MTTPASNKEHVTIIEPTSGWEFPDFKELKAYRDLFYFLVWRDIKVLYAQTVLGFARSSRPTVFPTCCSPPLPSFPGPTWPNR